MTITYTGQVATSSFACYLRLLLRWKGGIYKLVWKEFLVFIVSYTVLSLIHRLALNDDQKLVFDKAIDYCDKYSEYIPLSFILGFYVSIVVTRWWEQYNMIPWPDKTAVILTANLQGHDERGRLMRRTIVRYLNLVNVITLSCISPPIKKRFPSFTHMTEAGFMLPAEQKILEEINMPHNKYWIPVVWATSLVTRARKEGRIRDDFGLKTLLDEINVFRGMCGGLLSYDWISVPLVYTQVVTLAIYIFFTACLVGRQFPSTTHFDIYVPIFTCLQFFFYMGWLKVAESLCNPFGEDDDDFDLNWIIDRNLQVSYMMVDEMHQEHPELIKDQYWDEAKFEIPYTAAAAEYKQEPFIGSAVNIPLAPEQKEFIPAENLSKAGDDPEISIVDIGRQNDGFSEDGDSRRKSFSRQISSSGTTRKFTSHLERFLRSISHISQGSRKSQSSKRRKVSVASTTYKEPEQASQLSSSLKEDSIAEPAPEETSIATKSLLNVLRSHSITHSRQRSDTLGGCSDDSKDLHPIREDSSEDLLKLVNRTQPDFQALYDPDNVSYDKDESNMVGDDTSSWMSETDKNNGSLYESEFTWL